MAETVKVRIAVSVDPTGRWWTCGWGIGTKYEPHAHVDVADALAPGEARYWLTAELPIPETPEIEASVEEAT
jgi:hypothetical protein